MCPNAQKAGDKIVYAIGLLFNLTTTAALISILYFFLNNLETWAWESLYDANFVLLVVGLISNLISCAALISVFFAYRRYYKAYKASIDERHLRLTHGHVI